MGPEQAASDRVGLQPRPFRAYHDGYKKTGGANRQAGKPCKGNWIYMCAKATMEEFEALLNESLSIDTPDEGSVVKGRVIAIEAGQAIIDVGYKMEGRVDLKEFANPGEDAKLAVGDEVESGLHAVHQRLQLRLVHGPRPGTRPDGIEFLQR